MTSKSIDEIWLAVGRSAAHRRRNLIEPLREFLAQLDNRLAQILATGSGPNATDLDARKLEHTLIAQVNKGRITRLNAADLLGLVRAACRELNEKGMRVPETRLAAVFPPVESPFAPTPMTHARLGAAWRMALNNWIRSVNPISGPHWVSALILSSVTFGALLDTTKLKKLIEQINLGKLPEQGPACRTVSFNLPYQGMGNYHLQRWVVDPITEMLWYRMPPLAKPVTLRHVISGFSTFLASREEEDTPPKNLSHLVICMRADWSTRAPPIDLQVIQRSIQSHAFHPATWARLGTHSSDNSLFEEKKIRSKAPMPEEVAEALVELGTTYPWFEPLLEALELPTRRQVTQAVYTQRDAWRPSQPAATYFDWVANMLDGHGASGTGTSLESTREQVKAALPRLLASLGDQDLEKIDSLELEDIYSDLTHDDSAGQPLQDLVKGLRNFHVFLVRALKKAPITNDAEVFGEDPGFHAVSANLPSFDDYERAIRLLTEQIELSAKPKSLEAARLALILAFRLGMRRMEIFGLRLPDIHQHFQLEILIRPNARRRLKTKASRRRMPAYAFLSKAEIALLGNWVERRKRLGGEYLFAQDRSEQFVSWVGRISDIVCKALRTASGDERLYLHHCRHAFGTWTDLRLRAIDLPDLVDHFGHLPETASALRSGQQLAVGLGLSRSGPDGRHLHCVARLLGHSGPAVSLGHYIHGADLVHGAIARREILQAGRPLLIAASGLSQSAAYDAIQKGLAQLLASCRNKFAPKTSLALQNENSDEPKCVGGRPRKPPPHQMDGWIPLEKVLEVLRLSLHEGVAPEIICKHRPFSSEQVGNLLTAARQLGPTLRLEDAGANLIVPPMFREGAEQNLLKIVEPRLAAMQSRAPSLYTAGLTIHLHQLDRSKWDVAFRGSSFMPDLRTYLRFLRSMGFSTTEFQWLVRHPKTAEPEENLLPEWAKTSYSKWSPATVKRIVPPNAERPLGYASWAGVQAIDALGKSVGKLMARIFYLARVQAGGGPYSK